MVCNVYHKTAGEGEVVGRGGRFLIFFELSASIACIFSAIGVYFSDFYNGFTDHDIMVILRQW